jgi:hypothetical protein
MRVDGRAREIGSEINLDRTIDFDEQSCFRVDGRDYGIATDRDGFDRHQISSSSAALHF